MFVLLFMDYVKEKRGLLICKINSKEMLDATVAPQGLRDSVRKDNNNFHLLIIKCIIYFC